MTNKRKHRRQMTDAEIAAVERLVHAQTHWVIGKHATDRLYDKGINQEEVLDVMRTGRVVEVNQNNDLCIVMRKAFGVFAVCVVVSLQTRWVVTAWKNSARDKHATLDSSNYKWQVDLCTTMAAFA